MSYQYSVRKTCSGDNDVFFNRKPSHGVSREYNVRVAYPERFSRLAYNYEDSIPRLAPNSYNVRIAHPAGSYSINSSRTHADIHSTADNWSNITESGRDSGFRYHVQKTSPQVYNDHRSPLSTSYDSPFDDYHHHPRGNGSSKTHTPFPTRVPPSPRRKFRSPSLESSSHYKDSHSGYRTRIATPAYISPPPQPSPGVDLYAVLGVSRDATAEELKKAHRMLSLKHHPDRVPEVKKEEATENMARINQAYDVLNDGEKKDKFDRFGEF